MKKILLSLILSLTLIILIPSWVSAQSISSLPKPITGTFLMIDFNPGSTAQSWYPYFDDLKQAGMDTIVILAMGGQYCNQPEWNYFSNGVMQNVMQAAYDKGFKVYAGLAAGGQDGCASQQTLINLSISYISQLKTLNDQKGWGNWTDPNHFIQGFYINQEIPIRDARISPWTNFYQSLSRQVKSQNPSKKIVISPYKYDNLNANGTLYTDTYQTIYDGIYYLGANTNIDIFAPQDGVGARKVNTYSGNLSQFQAARDAVNKLNTDFGKNIQIWDNIETFQCPAWNNCPAYLPPTDFKTLRWQIRSGGELVDKKITWIYQQTLMTGAINYFSQYLPLRLALRNQYLSAPIIYAVFSWYTPANMVVKGYNLGSVGDKVGVYIHYNNNSQRKQFIESNLIFDIGRPYKEIRIPMSLLPGFDWNQPFDVAVQNKEGFVSYYRSQNPDTQPDPSFPEITLFSNVYLPGDLDHNGKVDIFDYNLLLQNFGLTACGNAADIDGNCKVDIFDYNILVGNFGK